jgi:hypothetical protein
VPGFNDQCLTAGASRGHRFRRNRLGFSNREERLIGLTPVRASDLFCIREGRRVGQGGLGAYSAVRITWDVNSDLLLTVGHAVHALTW